MKNLRFFVIFFLAIVYIPIIISEMPHNNTQELIIRILCLLGVLVFGVFEIFIGLSVSYYFDILCEYTYDKNFLGCQNHYSKEYYVRYSFLSGLLAGLRWMVYVCLLLFFELLWILVFF